MSNQIGKIEDAGNLVSSGRIDTHWNDSFMFNYRHLFSENFTISPWMLDAEKVRQKFGLRSIEFGNWLNQEDRFNFLVATGYSLQQLARTLRIKDSDIGLQNRLSIAFGARGQSAALAHYESNPYAIINLTKENGAGSLAHEYGHAIDNIISFNTKSGQSFVSGGRTTRKGFNEEIANKGNAFEKWFEELFQQLYFNSDGSKTSFHEAVAAKSEYWNRRNEVYARTFEAWINQKLEAKGIRNEFLVADVDNDLYPKKQLLSKVMPLLTKIKTNAFKLFNTSLNGLGAVYGYQGNTTVIKYDASLDDTLNNIKRLASDNFRQVASLARKLEGATVAETAENIWDYLRANTKYKLDEHGKEQLRQPARTLVDGKAGLTNSAIGVDCDDYTILVSALLNNLGIRNEARIASYTKKGAFQHIYPVAIDEDGNSYVIDIVPEIPHFNYEQKPIIDLITIPMTIEELSGLGSAEMHDAIMADMVDDMTEEMNQSALEGVNDEDDFELEEAFLYGFGEVDNEDEAEVIINGLGEATEVLSQGLLQQLQAARISLLKEENEPTFISQITNVPVELRLIESVIDAWNGGMESRMNALKIAKSQSQGYKEFFGGMLSALVELHREGLNGTGAFDEPIMLARLDMEDSELDEDLGRIFKRRRRSRGRLKKFFKKVGAGVKKAVKAVVRFNPATIAMRGAILLLMKINFGKFAEKLAYGMVSESEAKKRSFDMGEYAKAKRALSKAESFFVKAGGKPENFRKAIRNGRGWKKAGLSGLGAAATTAEATACPFVVFMTKLLKNINPGKIIQSIKERKKVSEEKANEIANEAPIDMSTDLSTQVISDPNMKKESGVKKAFSTAKEFTKKHKKPIIGGAIVVILVITAIVIYRNSQSKKKRSLAGAKAARTRKRNVNAAKRQIGSARKAIGAAPKRKTTRKRVNRTVASNNNGTRLKRMHAKAKQLQKANPRTKYSTLMKRAAKQIK